ncbi:MAG: Zn-ribbon domain-containing OB-fold protein [Gammaproteobacteria bacterium]|nr:Zn-ribbon domain-containing OB-fold protein [Gammaproteobacteria bacterium]
MNVSATARPLPRGEGYNGEFYEFCKNHELRFQRCTSCGTWRHMPRESCNACGSLDWRWEQSSGRGQVYSWTVIHRALHPGFADEVPYAAVIVELEEGVRLVSHVVDVAPDALRIGLPVEVFFERVDESFTLPKFKST